MHKCISVIMWITVMLCFLVLSGCGKSEESALRTAATADVKDAIKDSPIINDWRILSAKVTTFENGTKQGIVDVEFLGAGGFSETHTFHYSFDEPFGKPGAPPEWSSADVVEFLIDMKARNQGRAYYERYQENVRKYREEHQ